MKLMPARRSHHRVAEQRRAAGRARRARRSRRTNSPPSSTTRRDQGDGAGDRPGGSRAPPRVASSTKSARPEVRSAAPAQSRRVRDAAVGEPQAGRDDGGRHQPDREVDEERPAPATGVRRTGRRRWGRRRWRRRRSRPGTPASGRAAEPGRCPRPSPWRRRRDRRRRGPGGTEPTSSWSIVCAAPQAIEPTRKIADGDEQHASPAVEVAELPVQRHRGDHRERVGARPPRSTARSRRCRRRWWAGRWRRWCRRCELITWPSWRPMKITSVWRNVSGPVPRADGGLHRSRSTPPVSALGENAFYSLAHGRFDVARLDVEGLTVRFGGVHRARRRRPRRRRRRRRRA